MLDYYAGVFESVYVLLHPFIKPITIAPDSFKPSTYPDRKKIVESCEPVPWSEVSSSTGLTPREIDVGLRTQIGGLRAELANTGYAARLDSYCETNRIVPPDEGHFSDLLHDRFLGFIQELGYAWVWVGDEFGTARKLYWIEDLKGEEATATLGHCNVFTPDKSLLWTTHWDSSCSFVCGARGVITELATRAEFEGFRCTEKTHVYWGLGGA